VPSRETDTDATCSAINHQLQGAQKCTDSLSRFGCLIGENNSGKSSFLQALSLFFSGSKLTASYFFDASKPIRIAVTFEDIGEADLARLAEHTARALPGSSGTVGLSLSEATHRCKSALLYSTLTPTDARFQRITFCVGEGTEGRPSIRQRGG